MSVKSRTRCEADSFRKRIDTINIKELAQVVETTTVFAKLSHDQKRGSCSASKNNGHKVGYMNRINDAPSMKVSNVGISVDML